MGIVTAFAVQEGVKAASPQPKTGKGGVLFGGLEDTRAKTTAARGSFVPYVLGHKRVGATVLWVGNRTTQVTVVGAARSGGGKGRKKKRTQAQTQTTFLESGWHGLCVGPASRLHRIWKNGRVIFDTTLDSVTNPSGSSFVTSENETFTIYWGERNQAVNAVLGGANFVGISSRWPNLCYVVWDDVNVGPSPRWPLLEYEIEVEVSRSENASGTSMSTLCSSEKDFGDGAGGYTHSEADPANTGGRSEFNAAHIIDQVLFEQWPQGIGLPSSSFDIWALDALGDLIDTEGLFSTVYCPDGKSVQDVLTTLMEDVGFVMPHQSSFDTPGVSFVPVRDPSLSPTAPPTIPADMHSDEEFPEIRVSHFQSAPTKVLFQYSDRDLDYADMTIGIDEDGQANFLEHAKAQLVPVLTASTLLAASRISARRSQEFQGQIVRYTIFATKSGRYLTPGRAFFLEGLDDLLRVEEIEIPQHSGKVQITAVLDLYGLTASDFVASSSGLATPAQAPAAADLATKFLETPADLAGGQVAASLLRIRANDRQRFAEIHISRDDVTYQSKGIDFFFCAGGSLTGGIAATDDYEIAQGPQFTTLGPDISIVEDLSAQEELWRLGRQVAVINNEIFFLQKITAIGGTTYRLDGLIRARYNTAREAHVATDKVFIFQDDDATQIIDALIQAEENLYIKGQPYANGALSLASITAVSKLPVYGLGVRPEPVEQLRCTAPFESVNAYETGDDVTIEWSWFEIVPTPGAGAGTQNAGSGAPSPTIQGEFVLEILTLADVVVRTVVLSVASYTYSNANLQADLGSQVGFKAQVTHRNGGLLASPIPQIVVSKI